MSEYEYINKMIKMKLQSRFPYDSTLLGLEGKYQPLGADSFLIDSGCVMVKDHIIKTGQTYFLFDRTESMKTTGTAVKLIDCFYYLDEIYLLVVDVLNGLVILKNHTLDNGPTTCQWKLVDTNSIESIMDAKEKQL